MVCAPLEGWLTTSKVKGTGEINGCCCCMTLRGGVLTISATFAALTFFGLVFNSYVIADKGLGVPEGYPKEFPPNTTMSIVEIVAVLESLVATAVFGLAFMRVRNNELKDRASPPATRAHAACLSACPGSRLPSCAQCAPCSTSSQR